MRGSRVSHGWLLIKLVFSDQTGLHFEEEEEEHAYEDNFVLKMLLALSYLQMQSICFCHVEKRQFSLLESKI